MLLTKKSKHIKLREVLILKSINMQNDKSYSKKIAWLAILAISMMVAACSPDAVPPTQVASNDAVAAETAKETHPASTSFVNKVWQVSQSNAVSAGQIYVFLSDGTLVITAPQQKPSLGRWSYTDKKLVMKEEGIAYPVDILALTATEFKIKMHSPGEPVDIVFSLASSSM